MSTIVALKKVQIEMQKLVTKEGFIPLDTSLSFNFEIMEGRGMCCKGGVNVFQLCET